MKFASKTLTIDYKRAFLPYIYLECAAAALTVKRNLVMGNPYAISTNLELSHRMINYSDLYCKMQSKSSQDVLIIDKVI